MWRACDLRIEQGSPQAVFKFGGGRPPGFSAEVFPLLSVFAWFALSPPPPHTHTQDTFTIQHSKGNPAEATF